jgi:hypothetical protein
MEQKTALVADMEHIGGSANSGVRGVFGNVTLFKGEKP